MSELKPYPKYKDSGVEWIGEIPEECELLLLAGLIHTSSCTSIKYKNFNKDKSEHFIYPVIGGNGVMGYTNNSNMNNSTLCIGRVGALCGNIHYVDYQICITDNKLCITNNNENKVNL